MRAFHYEQAIDVPSALGLAFELPRAKYLGGGTNLIDLIRETIEDPEALVDVTAINRDIQDMDDGGLLIGAGASNTAVAAHPTIRKRFPVLSRAILSGASGQIRNMATVGGNILQRTRCFYFYDDAARCNKRRPGAGCDAIDGFNRIHAILGASPSCVATHPSDMCVALAALDAIVHLEGSEGRRSVPIAELHTLPGGTPHIETVLRAGELITAVELPPTSFGRRSTYRKVRDRASYAFALVSVAAAIDIGPDHVIRDVRIALGGVAHKPWRATAAEDRLRGASADEAVFATAAEAAVAGAAGLRDNAFKIGLARRVIVSTLQELTAPGVRP